MATGQGRDNEWRERMRAAAAGAAVAVLIFSGVWTIDEADRQHHREAVRSEAIHYASYLRARLEGAVNKRLRIAYGLSAFARTHFDRIPENFDPFAEALMQTGVVGIRSLQLAPNAVVEFVHPMITNQGIVGHDLLADPARNHAVRRAIDNRQFLIAGPLDLIQGGTGLIARLPIYRPRNDLVYEEDFWGFATIVLDVEPLLAEAGLYETGRRYDIALRGIDGLGAQGGLFFGNAALFSADPVLLDVTLPAGSWQLGVMPVGGWPGSSPASQVIWIVGAIFAGTAAGLAFILISAPATLRRQVVRATRSLRESEEQFRRIAETASDAIISTDAQGRITFWNPGAERAFGYHANEVIGEPVGVLIPEEYRGRHDDALDRLRAGNPSRGPGRTVTASGLRKDGAEFSLEISHAVWTAGGNTFYTAIIRDISARVRAERERLLLQERYHRAQRLEAIGTLAAGAAHEFNNLIGILIANAESALAALPPDSGAAGDIAAVLEGAWRAAAVVRRLLAFSEAQQGEREIVAVDELVGTVAAEIGEMAPPGVVVEVEAAASACRIFGDRQQLREVLFGVCMNGLQAMEKEGGRLRLAIGTAGEDECPLWESSRENGICLGEWPGCPAVRLIISDTGPGMTTDVMNRAFEPFFTTRPVGSGVGLGLAVVLGIVRSHGGAICMRSTPGGGTNCGVYLPAASVEPAA